MYLQYIKLLLSVVVVVVVLITNLLVLLLFFFFFLCFFPQLKMFLYNFSLQRHWRHSGRYDHRVLWKRDSGIPGEEPDSVGHRDGGVKRAA